MNGRHPPKRSSGSAPAKKRVGVISLGCPKNLVDTESLLGRFTQEGYVVTPDPSQADVLVVNTCGFLAEAEKESREAIREMAEVKAAHPGKKLVVMGCLAQRHGESLLREMPEIDLLLGSGQHDRAVALLQPMLRTRVSTAPVSAVAEPAFPDDSQVTRVLATRPHCAYLKIAEGCNNPCAFCIIPQLKGPYRSRTPESVLEEAKGLAGRGVRELILVSQDTTLYGRDLTPRADLAGLLESLEQVEGIRWIRMLYLYPTLINDRLLSAMAASSKAVPYFDLPLQHSHSAVLARMKRAEREESLEELVKSIRAKLPEATLRATFIVGFPGESEAEFKHLFDFVAASRFDHVGVFQYSDEPGTTAFDLPDKVPAKVAAQRRDKLMRLQQKISAEKLKKLVGRTLPVMVEGTAPESPAILVGRTQGQAPEIDGVVYLTQGRAHPGDIVSVKMLESHEYDLVGRIVR